MMRVLILADDDRRYIHELALFAAKPEHHYRPGPGKTPPGDDPRYRIRLGLPGRYYLCVFSFTVIEGALIRHLSISVPDTKGMRVPHPIACWMIADAFGFTGWDRTMGEKPGPWQIAVKREEGVVIIGELVA
jgi:hypothetical protein